MHDSSMRRRQDGSNGAVDSRESGWHPWVLLGCVVRGKMEESDDIGCVSIFLFLSVESFSVSLYTMSNFSHPSCKLLKSFDKSKTLRFRLALFDDCTQFRDPSLLGFEGGARGR